MAGLSNTGIKGFIASAKFTGSTILKKGKEIPEMVENFLSGFAGYGWKIWEHRKGKYKLEIDDLNVRGTMTVYELLIQKIRAVIGALAITQGQGKIKSVALSPDQSEYLIQVEEEMSFREYDFIRCQTWTGDVKMYHVKIDRISDNTIIHVPIEEFDTDYDEFEQLVIRNAPAIGDDIIQFGNEVYEDRQSAIYLHADENGQPAIDIMFGINSKDWTNCVKGRMGGDIPGADGAKGFYFENGMIKGTDETGYTVYCIYPNGNAMFGDGSAMFNSDRSGQLAGGAIQWHFNDDKGRFELTLGKNGTTESAGVFRGSFGYRNADNPTPEELKEMQNVYVKYTPPSEGTVYFTLPGGDASFEGTVLNLMIPAHTSDFHLIVNDGVYINGSDTLFQCSVLSTDKFVCLQVICFKNENNQYTWEVLNAYSKIRGIITSI